MIPAILIILIVHIIIAIRWMLIKILSAVINSQRSHKVTVLGSCYLNMIIQNNHIKIKQTFLQPGFPQYYIERLHGRLHRACRHTEINTSRCLNSIFEGVLGDHLRIHGVSVISSAPNAMDACSVCDPVCVVHAKEAIACAAVIIQLVSRVTEILLPIQSDHRPNMAYRFRMIAMRQGRLDAHLG